MNQPPICNGPCTEGPVSYPLSSPGWGRGGGGPVFFCLVAPSSWGACLRVLLRTELSPSDGKREEARENQSENLRRHPTLLKTLNGLGEHGVGGHVSPHSCSIRQSRGFTVLQGRQTWCQTTSIRALLLCKEREIDFGGQSLYRFKAG